MSLTEIGVRDMLRKFRDHRICVVGDLMLDRYVYGTVERISPEAPVPVVRIREERDMPGGACNVASNVRSLGGHCSLCGWVGMDSTARTLRRLLAEQGVETRGVLHARSIHTTTKTRIVAERQQVVRVDAESPAEHIPRDVVRKLIQRVERDIAVSDGVIIEDYGKGVVLQSVVDAAIRASAKRGIPVGFDPKDDHDIVPSGITFATPNRKEAFGCAGLVDPGARENPLRDRALLEAGSRLMERWSPEHLLITLGHMGMFYMGRNARPHHVPTRAREVFDVSGAGDTVIAVAAMALAAGADGLAAAEMANIAAGVVVGKLGTATCTPAEVRTFISRKPDFPGH